MVDYFQILSFYKKLKYNFRDHLFSRVKRKLNLDGNRFEVLRYLDDQIRRYKIENKAI